MNENHANSYYVRLDGEIITADVGYFEDCTKNGFLPDLKKFMQKDE